jgi:hypothetical protein
LTPYPPLLADRPPPARGYITEYVNADLTDLFGIQADIGANKLFLLCGPEISNDRILKVVPGKRGSSHKAYNAKLDNLYGMLSPGQIIQATKQLELSYHEVSPAIERERFWNISATNEGQSDYRISLAFNIRGVNHFLFSPDNSPVDKKGNKVFASIPLSIIVINHNRDITALHQFGIPVIQKPVVREKELWLQGNISFALSKLVSVEDFKRLYLWFVCMDNVQLLDIELEKGWTDGLVPPPAPTPIINR